MIATTPKEIKNLRKSGRAVREALDTMAAAAKPGVSTLELNDIGVAVLAKHSTKSAPRRTYKFPGDVCISINNEALHGIPSKDRILKDGDLLKLDLVAERHGYYTDAALTVVVGKGTDVDYKLIECAQAAFNAGLTAVRPGVPTNDIGKMIEGVAKEYGFGILDGFGGHGVGRSIHEDPFVPNYFMTNCTDVLQEGMVITIEPIICEFHGACTKLSDGWTIVTQDGGRVAHFEKTLAIYQGEVIILT